MKVVAVVCLVAASGAWAHTPVADEVVASLATPAARTATGIERVERDRRNPRVLLIRVGPEWFAQPREDRTGTATRWRTEWRRAVPDGIVAVLDARDRPVVRYGPGGRVAAVRD
jgi:hypothetical protein